MTRIFFLLHSQGVDRRVFEDVRRPRNMAYAINTPLESDRGRAGRAYLNHLQL